MSLARRVIPCLDVAAGRVVKGVNFENLRDMGDPVELAALYFAQGADELTFLDVTATVDDRATTYDVVRRTAEEVFALELVAEILGGGTTSRLYRRLCAEDELAAGASAYFMGSMVDRAAFQLSVSPRPGVAMATLESGLDAALAAFLADGPSELELARARTRLVAETVFARDNQASLARIFGSALAVGETVADVLAWPQRIDAVPREAVVEAARRYLRPDRSVTGLLLPA